FRALFDLGPIAIYSCDIDGAIQEFNACAVDLWGRAPNPWDPTQRFCGSAKMYRSDGTLMARKECPMAMVLKGEIPRVRDAEVIIERPDGSRITANVNIVPLKDGAGKIAGA